jgi:parvulin-like peptidyl-prolyl isomerase
VQDEVITLSKFEAATQRRKVGGDLAAKEALLDELIERKKWLVQAKEAGFEEDPEVRRQIEGLIIRRYQATLDQPEATPSLPTEEELQAYYNGHLDDFQVPERVRVAVIHVKAGQELREEVRQRKRAKIEEARAAALAQEATASHFGALAVEYSEDQSTRYQGGDLGYLVRGMVEGGLIDEALLDVAFVLEEPGDLSEIVEGGDGFYFLRLMEKNPASQRPFQAVQSQIRSQIIAQKQATKPGGLESHLRDDLAITRNLELLKEIEGSGAAATPKKPQPVPSGPSE